MKMLSKMFLVCLLATLFVSSASARLVVAAEGTLIAGATNTAFATKTVVLAEPVYYLSAEFYNTGTNETIAVLSKLDGAGLTTLATVTNAANAGAVSPSYLSTNVVANPYPLRAISLAATKTAGATNGTSSVLFYRVYGDTEK